MIEVEKKFILNDDDIKRLTEGAVFLSEKIFTDVYYDTTDYALTRSDKWLRSRDGRYELKLPLHSGADRQADQYDELEDELKIKEALNFSPDVNLEASMKRSGCESFCVCKTTRKKYKKDQFTIDLDYVDYGDFNYSLGEIELMVNDKPEIEAAIEKILNFAQDDGLTIGFVRGKVIEYIKRKRPEHYQALIKNDVIKDF
ncbi:MAG: CYTH domain-containing protein [Patescibacteria group bacterium]|nr:CYTH domain-containing protein [Patescibacteria group bacterium]